MASLTRTAAAEIAGRDLPIPRENVGTLHAHAYRTLGGDILIAEDPKIMADWNEFVRGKRQDFLLSVNAKKMDLDDFQPDEAGSESMVGDRVLAQLNIMRARMASQDLWPPSVMAFFNLWTDWKMAAGVLDFTDLLEFCLNNGGPAAGKPDAIIVDEAQDCSALELSLCRLWASYAQVLILGGDSDQCLFSFRGSQPGTFFEKPLPKDHVRILEQSYRVPRMVHKAATQWISLVEYREAASYLPRPAEGSVTLSNRLDIGHPELVVDRVEKLLADNKDEDQADAARPVVALLTTCGYMLEPMKKELMRRGLPFANPWRRRRADWNPLFASRGIPAADRLSAFLKPNEEALGEQASDWTAKDIRLWLAAIKTTGLISKKGKDRLLGLPEDAKVTWEELVQVFDEAAITEVVMADLKGALAWYEERLVAGKEKGMTYPLKVAKMRGVGELRRSPRVVISTIHAAKGGEAKNCLVFPDLSPAGLSEYRNTAPLSGGGRGNDSVYRLFYVAFTRARESLALCAPAGSSAVRWLRG